MARIPIPPVTITAAVATLLLSGALLSPAPARATPAFGSDDVRTVFHIAKSDDLNRVDYGIRLNDQCQPVGREPVYAYWHRFEPEEAVFGDLNIMDRQVYAVSSQSVRTRSNNGSWVEMRVSAFPELRILILIQQTSSGCVARAQIPVHHRPAFVDRVFVELGGFFSVASVTLSGVDAQTGAAVEEQRLPPTYQAR